MQPSRKLIQSQKKPDPHQKADHNRQPAAGQLQSRQQQRPNGGCQHHAGSKAQQNLLHPRWNIGFEKKHCGCAQRRAHKRNGQPYGSL
jgi:hypothetical protein